MHGSTLPHLLPTRTTSDLRIREFENPRDLYLQILLQVILNIDRLRGDKLPVSSF